MSNTEFNRQGDFYCDGNDDFQPQIVGIMVISRGPDNQEVRRVYCEKIGLSGECKIMGRGCVYTFVKPVSNSQLEK